MEEKFYTPREVAELAKVDTSTVHFWIKKGELRAMQVGSRMRIPAAYLGDVIKVITPTGLERYDPSKHGKSLT